MTEVTGKDIIERVSQKNKVNEKTVNLVMQSIIAEIKQNVEQERISIDGFGTFCMMVSGNAEKVPIFRVARKMWIKGRLTP